MPFFFYFFSFLRILTSLDENLLVNRFDRSDLLAHEFGFGNILEIFQVFLAQIGALYSGTINVTYGTYAREKNIVIFVTF